MRKPGSSLRIGAIFRITRDLIKKFKLMLRNRKSEKIGKKGVLKKYFIRINTNRKSNFGIDLGSAT